MNSTRQLIWAAGLCLIALGTITTCAFAGLGRIDLGEATVAGIMAKASLQDATREMGQAGMHKNHLLRVTFTETGKELPVTEAEASLIMLDPDNETTIIPQPMQKVSGHFEAAIDLAEEGDYTFRIRLALADGKPRVFDFIYNYFASE